MEGREGESGVAEGDWAGSLVRLGTRNVVPWCAQILQH